MREFDTPATYTVPEHANNSDSVFRHAEQTPDTVLFNVATGAGDLADITAAEFAATVTDVAKGLIATGIQPGDRIAIMAPTRYEWVVLDHAIWAAGGCTVAIYDSSAAEQAKWILLDSATRLLIVDSDKHHRVIDEIDPAALPDLAEVLRIDQGVIGELTTRGAELDDAVVHTRRAQVVASSPATLIYTSGTTGRPKGVLLSHANLYAESKSDRIALSEFVTEGNKTLMFLPLAHVFARAVTLAALDAKVVVAFSSDWSTLVDQFGSFRPHFILAVPRVFEKVFHGAKQKAHAGGKGRIFDRATETAIAWSESLDSGGPGQLRRLEHALFDRLVYRQLRTALGGRCEAAVSGGGPLGARLGHFFRGAGIPVYEGYGLTETTAAITVNTPQNTRVGTVGRPTDGHAVKIADDGELLLRGPVVFDEYWGNPDATADAFTDGWFRTGDLGAIDRDGYLTITGRKKEILVTAGGKNVSPGVLEDSLRAHSLIGQAMVVGDGRPFVGALVTLDPEALPAWRQRHNVSADLPLEQLIEHPVLVAEIDAAVADTNKLVSHAEAIKKVRILPTDWTEATGELTPKMSLKRATVMKKYAADVEAVYL
ncbi:long-chain fatty acid--CoA ligase [Nocardia asteroides NBRC 15531]|uniref:Long-chain fatty-acid--CoA ligase n=1 Tax=Nocardia asteroides NBRC 15531 TaxID=1110697 RepID=U5E839_NOCAS|nr:long-chain fatty acid--CoA ligase [Nocardia asteroides]TLF67259.1 long-chain fatty acid--CoA ligase [Nocardia asteroides NBRC 15531]UGT51455.1 long-chain fatty acid--CoA ligase [Nocardia asteroides]SFM26360.1 long-chain acyl-CoA synthetase [Nocardia asteroides]VEG35656.1 Long-chain-fatty-acid--CoA ligase FadD15 [Nocardia asteroides]GAD86182.1 long-chain fatty-acid--CoA ligase [Nocardia asteroides NBRC 15531]